MARKGSSRRQFERELERRSHEAIELLEQALVGDDPERAVIAAVAVVMLAERSVYRDTRLELVAAGELLRPPPAAIDPVRRRLAWDALQRLAEEAERQADRELLG